MLSVAKAGTGTGTVTSSPAGISCGADCSEPYNSGTVVTLSQAATAGSTFTGWSGACTGTGACQVTVDAAKSVTATFALNPYTLTVAKAGTGTGTVTSSPAGISCGADCSQPYNSGTVVTLSQAATAGSTFTGWSGACTGTGACQVTVDAAKSVTATFALNPYTLTVAKAGTGTGTVTSSPAGISCGADCSEPYNSGTVVTLSQAATAGSTFTGWSGACTGTGACQVTMSAAKSVTATFAPAPNTLTVTKAGTGSGTITSTPAGISCGADCSQAYNPGTLVTLSKSRDCWIHLHGLERSLHRNRRLPGHHECRQVRHRHLHPEPLHPDRDEGGNRQRNRHLFPRRHQLWRRLLPALQPRYRRHPQPRPRPPGPPSPAGAEPAPEPAPARSP